VETAVCFVLLLLLAGVAIAIYAKGRLYDPGLFRPELTTLAKQHISEVQPSDAPKAGPTSAVEQTASVAAHPLPASSGLLDDLAPSGWKPMENVTHFTADTLYEKIDGRAEEYLDYKLVSLSCVSLVNAKDNKQFIDIYLYDMAQPVQAFGVFSVERTEDLPMIKLGREGYRAESSYFFWKGRYYVQLVTSTKGAEIAQVGLDVARTLEKRLKDNGEPLWGFTALPEKDRVPGSVQYYAKDAMSLDFMKDTYIALYNKGGTKVTAFVSKQPSPGAAAKTLASYEAHMKKYGKLLDKRGTDGNTLLTADMGGAFDVVFHRGSLIGGVSMVEDRDVAEKAAQDILADLPDKG
jgi:hypothetical protein